MRDRKLQPVNDPGPRGRPKTAQAVTIALLLVGLLTAIFVIQNTADTQIEFLFWSAELPLAGALILAAVLGGTLAFLVAYIRYRQFKTALRQERRQRVGPPSPREPEPEARPEQP